MHHELTDAFGRTAREALRLTVEDAYALQNGKSVRLFDQIGQIGRCRVNRRNVRIVKLFAGLCALDGVAGFGRERLPPCCLRNLVVEIGLHVADSCVRTLRSEVRAVSTNLIS